MPLARLVLSVLTIQNSRKGVKMRQFYLLISFVLIAASLLSGGVLPCDSAFASIVVTAVTTDIHVTNFADGEIINYDLPLLKGTAQGSDSISITTGNSTLNWSVREGRWRAFVPLQVGENIIILTSGLSTVILFVVLQHP